VTVTVWPEMVTDPVRAATVFGRTENVSEPLPDPLEGVVSTMNASLLIATHLQTLLVVIVIVVLPPLAPTDTLVGDRTIEQRPPPALNDSTVEKAVVIVPLVARARQKYTTPCVRSRGTGQLVVPLPCATPSWVMVLAGSSGNVLSVDTSNRYLTVPTLPVAAALLTTSVGRSSTS